MPIDRFHNSWVGSRASVRKWFEQFMHCYKCQRQYQTPEGKTPVGEVQN